MHSALPVASAPLEIVAISDTHGHHWELTPGEGSGQDYLPAGDVLIHCGDIFDKSSRTSREAFEAAAAEFNEWLGAVKHRYAHGIIVVPGNHDYWLEVVGPTAAQLLLSNCVYLVDEGCVIEGVSFHGCPVSSGKSSNRAFQSDHEARRKRLPESVDVLITHGPADNECTTARGTSTIKEEFVFRRCRDDALVPRCRLHFAGHRHEAYGTQLLTVVGVSAEDARGSPLIRAKHSPHIRQIGRIDGRGTPPRSAAEEFPSQPYLIAPVDDDCVHFTTVSVVASSLNEFGKLTNRPVEVALIPAPRGAAATRAVVAETKANAARVSRLR